jgi:hypothetical protein
MTPVSDEKALKPCPWCNVLPVRVDEQRAKIDHAADCYMRRYIGSGQLWMLADAERWNTRPASAVAEAAGEKVCICGDRLLNTAHLAPASPADTDVFTPEVKREMYRNPEELYLDTPASPAEGRREKMFSFDFELRGDKARVEGWFSGGGDNDPCEFDIDAIWIGWTEETRGMPEHAGGPSPLDLSTLTDDEEEALTDAAWSAVADLKAPDCAPSPALGEDVDVLVSDFQHAVRADARGSDKYSLQEVADTRAALLSRLRGGDSYGR